MSPEEYVVETFKISRGMAERLSFTANRLDISKSRLIREALTHYMMTINAVEDLVKESIVSDFLKSNIKQKSS